MDGGIVQNHRQGLVYLLSEPAQKANEHICRRVLPIPGAEHLAAGQKGSQHVQALAAFGFYQVAFAAFSPGTAVGMHPRKAHLVQIGQFNLAAGGLVAERLHFYGCLAKGFFVAAFFNE